MTETDNEIMNSQKKRHAYMNGSQSPRDRNRLDMNHHGMSSNQRRNRSIDDDNDYIIGPNSNHSKTR
jgi:hypothetical protein